MITSYFNKYGQNVILQDNYCYELVTVNVLNFINEYGLHIEIVQASKAMNID